jgi:hypothetical protein
MPDSILSEAIAKRDAAAAEVQRWSDFIAMYRELTGQQAQDDVSHVAPRPALPKREPVAATTGALAETEGAAIEVIKAAGRAIPTREMLEALRARGVEVGGKDPASTLSARLSRASALENVRPYGWRLKKLADDNSPTKEESSAISTDLADLLGPEPAKGREAGPGGDT